MNGVLLRVQELPKPPGFFARTVGANIRLEARGSCAGAPFNSVTPCEITELQVLCGITVALALVPEAPMACQLSVVSESGGSWLLSLGMTVHCGRPVASSHLHNQSLL